MRDFIVYCLVWLVDKLSKSDDRTWHITHESSDGDYAGVLKGQNRRQVIEFILLDMNDHDTFKWEFISHIPRRYPYNEKS